MVIYVVQVGDTITSIANKFGVSEARLIYENGISNPTDLVIGQTIVISYPQKTYLVKEGDTLSEIAFNHKFGYRKWIKWYRFVEYYELFPSTLAYH